MTLGIICTIMPAPFPLLVPISIGTIRIISNAIRSEKEPPPAQPVVYCNGKKEQKNKGKMYDKEKPSKPKSEQRKSGAR